MSVSVNARLTGTQNIDEPSSKGYGATALSSDATNKTALQDAIAAVDINGGGAVINQHDIDYGFRLTDPATYPDFSGTTTDMVVLDYGPGLADPAGNKQGAQVRYFFNTQPIATAITFTAGLASAATSGTLTGNWESATGPYAVTFSNGDVRNVTLTLNATSATWATGLTSSATANATHPLTNHNGNLIEIHGDWNPGAALFNDSALAASGAASRTAPDNRRVGIVFGNDGYSYWLLGQGTLAGANYTDEELSNFHLAHYQQTGDTLANYAPLIIERQTGNWSFGGGTNSPLASYHFKSVTAGYTQALFESLSTTTFIGLRNSNGIDDDVYIQNVSGNLQLYVQSQGIALEVEKGTRRSKFVSTTSIVVLPTYSTNITPDAALGNIFIITATDGVAFSVAAPVNPGLGQIITLTIKNTSGDALGVASFGATIKMAAWTQPATGFSRSIDLYYDNSNWIEKSRTTADIPN